MDMLTPFFDTNASTSTNNRRIFESAQSRFKNRQIPQEECKWVLCDHCGNVISQTLYQNHLIQHEMMQLCYQLHHYEIGEEEKRQKLIERIHRKEEHRRLGLELSADSSISNSSSGSSSTSSLPPSSASSVCSSPIPSAKMPTKKIARKDNKIVTVSTRKRKMCKMELSDGMEEKENNLDSLAGASSAFHKSAAKLKKKRTAATKARKRVPLAQQGKLKKVKKQGRPKKKMGKKKEEMTTEMHKRAQFENRLCLKNLGPKYKQVFVDLRRQRNYFDHRGRINLATLKKLEMKEEPKEAEEDGPSPPKFRRRSLRGGAMMEDDELVALL